jgi:methionyl aminopeptidase
MVRTGLPIYSLSKNIVKTVKEYGFNTIIDLCGHQIDQYKIHSGFVVPNILFDLKKNLNNNNLFTIEPFVTTGNGNSIKTHEITHYMFDYHNLNYQNMLKNNLIPNYLKQYQTLAFNSRHFTNIDDLNHFTELNQTKTNSQTKSKSNSKISNLYVPYPPIIDPNPDANVCQFETTIYIDDIGNVINYKQHQQLDKYLLV